MTWWAWVAVWIVAAEGVAAAVFAAWFLLIVGTGYLEALGWTFRWSLATPKDMTERGLKVVEDAPTRFKAAGGAEQEWAWRRIVPGVRLGYWVRLGKPYSQFLYIGKWGQRHGFAVIRLVDR